MSLANLHIVKTKKMRDGQAMLFFVVVVGSLMLIVTTIAGYITTQRIYSVRSASNSLQAIYGADAGIECNLYKYFASSFTAQDTSCDSFTLSTLPQQTSVETTSTMDTSSSTSPTLSVRSVGRSNNTSRAYYLGASVAPAPTSTPTSTP
jgi:hypothetical protein